MWGLDSDPGARIMLGAMGIGGYGFYHPWEQWKWTEPLAGVFAAGILVITHNPKSGSWKVSSVWSGRNVPVHQGFCIPRQRRTPPNLLPFLDLRVEMI